MGNRGGPLWRKMQYWMVPGNMKGGGGRLALERSDGKEEDWMEESVFDFLEMVSAQTFTAEHRLNCCTCMVVCTYACTYACMVVCVYVCMCVCVYVCMCVFACKFVCI